MADSTDQAADQLASALQQNAPLYQGGAASDGPIPSLTPTTPATPLSPDHEALIAAADDAQEQRRLLREEQDRETNFWRLRNCTIPLFYFILGFALRYPTVALRVFMIKELVVEPHEQSLIAGVVMLLPFSLKIFFAFISDGVAILGQRRKPYMIGGVLLAAGAWITLGLLERPSIAATSVLLFLATLGIVWADTMVDTLVVERMRYEHGKNVGNMQTTCWMLRYAGMFIGILLGGWLLRYAHTPPQELFISLGCVIFVVLFPAMFPLADDGMRDDDGNPIDPPSFSENVSRIWDAVQLNSIWKPMIFVYIWNVLPNDGDAWVNYLMGPLHFSDDEYSYILAIGTLSGAVGALLYKACLKTTGLHIIFYCTIIVSALLSCIPFILITRANRDWGIPDFAFAMGNEVINDVAGFIMYMPVLIMCSKLCPNKVEGSVYALTCVVNNIGSQISMSFSSMLTHEFGITLKDYSRLWELHLVVVLLMFIPLAFVHLTPNRPGEGNPDELRRRKDLLTKELGARRAERARLHATGAFANSPVSVSVANTKSGEEEKLVDNGMASTSNGDGDASDEGDDQTTSLRQRVAGSRHGDGNTENGETKDSSSSSSSSSSGAGNDDDDNDKKRDGCCKCCGESRVAEEDDHEGEIDELTISEEKWREQEQKMEDELEDIVVKLQSGTSMPTSAVGGGAFMAVVFGSLIWSTIHASIRLSSL